MNIWNFWALHHRNARALGAAVALLIALISMSFLRCNPMVGREDVSGVVIEIEAVDLRPLGEGEAQARVRVVVADSVEVRLFLPPPVPQVGDVIPLIVEYYKKGDSLYSLDRPKWRIDGPR